MCLLPPLRYLSPVCPSETVSPPPAAPPPGGPALLHRLAALVLPLLVLGAWYGSLPRFPHSERYREQAHRMDAQVMGGDWSVLVLGNSLARTDVDPQQLGRHLDRPGDVLALTQQGTSAPTWYAILKYRVFTSGLQPQLIVIPSTLDAMLATHLASPESVQRLEGHLDGDDPVLDSKVFGGGLGGAPWGRVRRLSPRLRAALEDGAKTLLVGLLLGPGGQEGSWWETGIRQMAKAREKTFSHPGGAEPGHQQRLIAVDDLGEGVSQQELPSHAHGSMLPDLLRLISGHGARVVFARVPLRADNPRGQVPPSLEREWVAHLERAPHATYLDLSHLPVGHAEFADPMHLNQQGARRFTEALATALLEARLLDDVRAPSAGAISGPRHPGGAP